MGRATLGRCLQTSGRPAIQPGTTSWLSIHQRRPTCLRHGSSIFSTASRHGTTPSTILVGLLSLRRQDPRRLPANLPRWLAHLRGDGWTTAGRGDGGVGWTKQYPHACENVQRGREDEAYECTHRSIPEGECRECEEYGSDGVSNQCWRERQDGRRRLRFVRRCPWSRGNESEWRESIPSTYVTRGNRAGWSLENIHNGSLCGGSTGNNHE